MKMLSLLVLAGCGSVTGISPDASVVTLTVTPDTVMTKRGLDAPKQLSAMASVNGAVATDVTSHVTWDSSDATVASVAGGLVTPLRPGNATITAHLGTATAMASFAVTNPHLSATQVGQAGVPAGIYTFDAYATGDTAPLHVISGASTTFVFPWAIKEHAGELFVADPSNNSVDVFPEDGEGDIAPIRQIIGPTTGITQPYPIAILNDEIYVGSTQKVLVFPLTATGDVAPTRTITGPATGLTSLITGLAIYKNEIYVMNGNASVVVFPVTADGNATPTRSIAGLHTQLSGSYEVEAFNDELFIGGTSPQLIVFATTDSGDVVPRRVLSGDQANISAPIGIQLVGNELFVLNALAPVQLQVFDPVATGNTMPKRQLAGATSMLASPRQLIIY